MYGVFARRRKTPMKTTETPQKYQLINRRREGILDPKTSGGRRGNFALSKPRSRTRFCGKSEFRAAVRMRGISIVAPEERHH